MLKNWPHKNSNIIIIVSLPMQYKIIESYDLGTYDMADAAFYYTPSKELRDKYSLTNSSYVLPEFIVGYYDAITDSFTLNPKYYENLSKQQQEELFNQVKQNYFNIIHDGCGIERYEEVIKDLGMYLPLSFNEIDKFKHQKEEQEILTNLPIELLNKPLKLPDGNTMVAEEYIKNKVLPYIPTNGKVALKNGSMIPILHFIIECAIYDCQDRYNGDFSRYIEENVVLSSINKTINRDDTSQIQL